MATIPKIDQKDLNDPYFKNYLTRAQNDFGLDPSQQIDLNDPWTKLTMTIILITLEQGRDNYSYDQFIKGIAKSIGENSSDYDNFIQTVTGSKSTQLGFENGSGSTGFVSPATAAVTNGGSSISITASLPYVSAIAQGALGQVATTAANPLGGLTNYLTSAASGLTNSVNNVVNTVTGAFTNTGVTQGSSTVGVVSAANGGTGGTVLVLAGTNDYGNTTNTAANIQSICDKIVANGGTPVVVAPAANINGIGNNNAQDAVIAGARAGGYQVITPTQDMFVKETGGAQYHLSAPAIQNIANQAASLTGQKVVLAEGDSNAVRAQQVLNVSGTATVGIGTGQILKDVGSNMPVIGSPVTQNNLYSSLNDNNPLPTADQIAADQKKFDQGIGGQSLNPGSTVTVNGHTYSVDQYGTLTPVQTAAPVVAVTATPTVDQVTADQKQFDTSGGPAVAGTNNQVVVNGHTYTVSSDGQLTPAVAPSTAIQVSDLPATDISIPPNPQQVTLSDGTQLSSDTQVLATYDTSNKLVGVTYVTPPPSIDQLIAQKEQAKIDVQPLQDQYTALINNGGAGTAESNALLSKIDVYDNKIIDLSNQINQGSQSPGISYTLNLQTGKLTNDITQEVTGTVTPTVNNTVAQDASIVSPQYNLQSLQQQQTALQDQLNAGQITAGEYLAQRGVINQQITALSPTATANEAGTSVQVAYNNVGNVNDATPIVSGSQDTSYLAQSQVDAYLGTSTTVVGPSVGYIAQPGYNAGIATITGTSLDPTTRGLGTIAATTSMTNQIAGMNITQVITNSDGSTTTIVQGTSTTDPAVSSNTATPVVTVDDPNVLPAGYGSQTSGYETSFYVGTGTPAVQGPNDYGATATGAYTEVAGYVTPVDTSSSNTVSLPTFAQAGINGGGVTSTTATYGPATTASGFGVLGPESSQTLAPGYTATTPVETATALTTPTTTTVSGDGTGTVTNSGGDSQAGSTNPSSPGGPASSAASAAMGGGGC